METMKNEQLFNCVAEMVKQFDWTKNEDEYREKCIDLVKSTFNLDFYQAEVLFDLSLCSEALYLSDTDSEIEFDIQYDSWHNHFKCWQHKNNYVWRDYWTSWNFKTDTPILQLLKDLDRIWKAIEKLEYSNMELDDFTELAPLI